MNSMKRYVVCALFSIAALCVATTSHAQSPFDGTWKTNLSQAKFSPKPITFYISEGWYHCVSCTPAFDIQADGQDHAVTGQSYDTESVTVVDAHTISLTTKKGGKITGESTRTVSADGKTLTVKGTFHPMNSDQAVTYNVTAKRSGIVPSGVHATSGDWVTLKETESENDLLTTYKTNGDEFTMSDPTGETYTAKFDGADYPVKGSYGSDAVSLKKINDHTIEETYKRGGTVIAVHKMTVAANGKTMTVVDTAVLSGRTSTFTATKQ